MRVITTVIVCAVLGVSYSNAQAGEVTAAICNQAGACAPVEPTTALLIAGLQQLVDEFNKGDKGFGPNGEVVKAINTILNDLKYGGLGENNDIVKAFRTIHDDLTKGPGENNDIIKALRQLGIKIK